MKYYCHLCKKEEAKASMSYPNVVVCRCSGKLEEVGNISSSGQYLSLGLTTSKPESFSSLEKEQAVSRVNRLNQAQTAAKQPFEYQAVQLTSIEETRRVGLGMDNACSVSPDRYFNDGPLYLFIPNSQGIYSQAQINAILNDSQSPVWKTVYLCLVENSTRTIKYLLGYKNKNLDPAEYQKIQDYMRKNNLIA